MYRQEPPKRRLKQHFAGGPAGFSRPHYPHRLNFYITPPTEEVTLDQFEEWAISRLKVLVAIEKCQYRNFTPQELENDVLPRIEKELPLSADTSRSSKLQEERRKDHYSHFILRLAFARSPDLQKRFSRAESVLFKLRFNKNDRQERQAFVKSLDFNWETVPEDEKLAMKDSLIAATGLKSLDGESFFKVDWERVHDLVEQRRVLLRAGKAYVPVSMQLSLVLAEFNTRLDKSLELTSRALPRLDEDDRLTPILNHLSLGFVAPEFTASATPTTLNGATLDAASIDGLVQYFPMCMRHLHTSLRRDKLLKHSGRYQYNLFLKGIGLSVEEAIVFWRTSFSLISDEKFQKDYRYNVRHAYGLEGTRRNYLPLSCHQILLEHAPKSGEAHGCPYRHFNADNLITSLSAIGISDREVLKGVRTDVEDTRYHMACTRVFEHTHARELKREKESGTGSAKLTETITHPNEYFLRSFGLKNPGSVEESSVAAMDLGVDPML